MSTRPIPATYRPVITRTVRGAVTAARPAGLPDPAEIDDADQDFEDFEDVDDDQGEHDVDEGVAGERVVDLGSDPWTGAARLVGVRLMRAQAVRVHPAWTVRLAGALAAHALRVATADPSRDQDGIGDLLTEAGAAFTSYDPYDRMEAGLSLRRAASRAHGLGGVLLDGVGRWLTAADAGTVLATTGHLCRAVDTALTRDQAAGELYRRAWLPLAFYSVCGPVLLASLRAGRTASSGPMTTQERSMLKPVVQACWATGTWRTRVSLAEGAGISRPTLNDWINESAEPVRGTVTPDPAAARALVNTSFASFGSQDGRRAARHDNASPGAPSTTCPGSATGQSAIRAARRPGRAAGRRG